MRKSNLILVAIVAGVTSGRSDEGQNRPPYKFEGYTVSIQIYMGDPKETEKRNLKQICSFNNLVGIENTPKEFVLGFDKPVGKGKAFYGHKLKYQFVETAENCVEIHVQTLTAETPNVDPSTAEENVAAPIVFKHKYTEQVQYGGTIRLRMSPENEKEETWVEIKINKYK